MPIHYEKKIIFIHFQRTAGTTIFFLFAKNNCKMDSIHYYKGKKTLNRHIPPRKMLHYVGQEMWNDCWRFSFVRNPFDRFVSLYYLRKGVCGGHHLPHINYSAYPTELDADIARFKLFVKSIPRSKKWTRSKGRMQTMSQYEILTEIDGKMSMDFVGRFERLREDMDVVCEKAEITNDIPSTHYNKSDRVHYSRYYDNETMDIIGKRCKLDLDYFGYDFKKE